MSSFTTRSSLLTAAFAICFSILLGPPSTLGQVPRSDPGAKRLSAQEIARSVTNSVVSIKIQRRDGGISSGSGFFVNRNVVATAYHVVNGYASGEIRLVQNSTTYRISRIIGFDEKADLALLQISGVIGSPLTLNSGNNPEIGEEIFAIGNPVGLEGTFSQGIVSGRRSRDRNELIQITAPISRGSSGGPIVDSFGRVVGLAIGAIESGQSLNFATSVSILIDLMRVHSVVGPVANSSNSLGARSIGPGNIGPKLGDKFQNQYGMEFSFIPAGSFTIGTKEPPKVLVLTVAELRGLIRPLQVASKLNDPPEGDEWLPDSNDEPGIDDPIGFFFDTSFQDSCESARTRAYGPMTNRSEGSFEFWALRTIDIRNPVWFGTTEVTQGQYELVMGSNPSNFKECGKECPVETVSWNDAKEFVRRLNLLDDGFTYALPSEAEWEFVARRSGANAFTKENAVLGTSIRCPLFQIPIPTRKAKTHQADIHGIHDLFGSVSEWVEDVYSDPENGLPKDGSPNLKGDDPKKRVLRGGSWDLNKADANTRESNSMEAKASTNGFRVIARPKPTNRR